MPSTCCPNCGHAIPAAKRAAKGKRKPTITLAGRNWPGQRAEYETAMRVKRGELVWDELVNADRFGARGGWATPESYAERRAVEVDRHVLVVADRAMVAA